MLEILKAHKTSKGVSVNQYLQQKHPKGKWIVDPDELSYNVEVAHLIVKYRWRIINGELEAVSGRAVELTPDLHSITREIDAKRRSVHPEHLQIYDYVRNKFGEIESMEESIKDASERFGLTEKEVEAIYLKVDNIIYG